MSFVFLCSYLASLLLVYGLCLQPLVQDVHHLPAQIRKKHGKCPLSHFSAKLADKYWTATV